MNTLNNGTSESTIDPVCGMDVNQMKQYHYNYQGKTIYFCSQHCLEDFEKHPNHYQGFHGKKKKGLWGRYLERLQKATGGTAMKCH